MLAVIILWALGLFLKLAGATVDVSWHFQHLRETLAIPHLVNALGFSLTIGLTLYQTRHKLFPDHRSRNLIWGGLVIFLVAMPADELYHRAFGVDLTTYSPTHFMLYIGTLVTILGVISTYWKQRRPGLATSLLFGLFLMEDIVFPLGQQEYGSIQVWLLAHGQTLVDSDLMHAISTPFAQTYGGFPLALYPVYLIFAYLFAMALARRVVLHPFGATLVTLVYLAYRLVSWEIFHTAQMPTSFIPYFVLGMALLVDVTATYLRGWLGLVSCAAGATAVAYLSALLLTGWVVMPIWPMGSVGFALVAAVAGLCLGRWVGSYALAPSPERQTAEVGQTA
jgi:hypothetical protein